MYARLRSDLAFATVTASARPKDERFSRHIPREPRPIRFLVAVVVIGLGVWTMVACLPPPDLDETARRALRDGLFTAAASGDAYQVQTLLNAGADVNCADQNGYTALIVAAGNGNLNAVRALLRHGAMVSSRTGSGTTALSAALAIANPQIARILLEAGEDPSDAGASAAELHAMMASDATGDPQDDTDGAIVDADPISPQLSPN